MDAAKEKVEKEKKDDMDGEETRFSSSPALSYRRHIMQCIALARSLTHSVNSSLRLFRRVGMRTTRAEMQACVDCCCLVN